MSSISRTAPSNVQRQVRCTLISPIRSERNIGNHESLTPVRPGHQAKRAISIGLNFAIGLSSPPIDCCSGVHISGVNHGRFFQDEAGVDRLRLQWQRRNHRVTVFDFGIPVRADIGNR